MNFSMRKILPFFVIVPIIELVLLIGLADIVGFIPTLLLIITTALVGVTMLKRQGSNTVAKIRAAAKTNKVPTNEVIQGLMLFFAGGLLLTPGLLTDLIGFLILIPQSRKWIATKIEGYAQGKIFADFTGAGYSYEDSDKSYQEAQKTSTNPKSANGTVIEGEFTEEPSK